MIWEQNVQTVAFNCKRNFEKYGKTSPPLILVRRLHFDDPDILISSMKHPPV
jgi:hypothetical protein